MYNHSNMFLKVIHIMLIWYNIFQMPGNSNIWNQGYSSPWVELVDRSINSHRDRQGFLAASLPHQVDYTSKPCATHMSRASGNTLTDQTHNVTVQLWRQNTQRGQDIIDLFSVPTVTERKKKAKWKGAEQVFTVHVICKVMQNKMNNYLAYAMCHLIPCWLMDIN